MMRASVRATRLAAATTSMVAMLWSTGRIAHGALVNVQSTQGVAGRGGWSGYSDYPPGRHRCHDR